jgi:hypothetical protein
MGSRSSMGAAVRAEAADVRPVFRDGLLNALFGRVRATVFSPVWEREIDVRPAERLIRLVLPASALGGRLFFCTVRFAEIRGFLAFFSRATILHQHTTEKPEVQ